MSEVGATSSGEGSAGSGEGALPLGTSPAETGQFREVAEETYFKVNKTTRMEKVFNTYATRKDVPVSSLCFRLDGLQVSNEGTPETLELEDQDQIECFPGQAFVAAAQASDTAARVQSLTKPWRPSSSCTCLSPGIEAVKEELRKKTVDLEQAEKKLERRTLVMILTSLAIVPLAMWVAAVATAAGGW